MKPPIQGPPPTNRPLTPSPVQKPPIGPAKAFGIGAGGCLGALIVLVILGRYVATLTGSAGVSPAPAPALVSSAVRSTTNDKQSRKDPQASIPSYSHGGPMINPPLPANPRWVSAFSHIQPGRIIYYRDHEGDTAWPHWKVINPTYGEENRQTLMLVQSCETGEEQVINRIKVGHSQASMEGHYVIALGPGEER